jgi:PPOX class probable F420-dependent enzyme
VARHLTPMECLAFLASGVRTGKLALGGASGPIVVPIWFVVDGEDLVFTTNEATAKGRRLRADSRAALCCDDEAFPYGFVQARGPVTLQDLLPEELLPWTTRIAARYVPADRAEAFGARNAVAGELLCRLHGQRLVGALGVADE